MASFPIIVNIDGINAGPESAVPPVGWASPPGGLDGTIQYNNNGVLGGYAIGSGLSVVNGALTATGGGSVNFADNETPSGTVDGANKVFTLAHAPSPSSSLNLFWNGQRLVDGSDFTLSGLTITYAAGFAAPVAGDSYNANYRY